VAVRKALEGSLPSLQPDPSLLLLALEGLARLPLVREHKSPLAKDEHPDPLLLTTTTLLRQVVGTQDVTVMVAAAALLCRSDHIDPGQAQQKGVPCQINRRDACCYPLVPPS
jgi:hypothetical protein